MDDSINNFMVDNRIRFLENRDNNSRWCDPDVSIVISKSSVMLLSINSNTISNFVLCLICPVSIQNGSNLECPDLDFVYNDTDTHPNEIAELYSYTEQNEFHLNVKVCVTYSWHSFY